MESEGGDSNKRVVVAVRIRPKLENVTNATQVAERYHPEAAMRVNETTVRLSESKGKETKTNVFSFDHVFDRDSTQQEVYEDTTLEAVDAALQGCNATIMTYGQTGSGKTYTVLGSVKSNPLSDDVLTQDTGLFLRVLKDILHFGESRAAEVHTVVCLSVIEIYLESVRDLLSKTPTENMRMSIDGENVHMPDLTYVPIQHLRDAINAYKVATARRVCRATEANDQSSRSHALFAIDVYQQRRTERNPEPLSSDTLTELRIKQQSAPPAKKKESAAASPATPAAAQEGGAGLNPPIPCPGMPSITYSRIVLTDLAGSEKMKHSNAKGEGFEEMKKINGSLTSLGNVVHSLYSGAKHIPYRDSKLTLLLRSSFAAPNAHVVLIANMAPTSLTFDETLSTLFFANKVKAMKVASTGNVDLSVESSYLQTLRQLEELGSELRILRDAHEYAPQIRRRLGPEFYSRDMQVLLTGGDPKRKERVLREHVTCKLQEEVRAAAEDKKSGRSGVLQEIFAGIVRAAVDDHDRAVAHQHEQIEKLLRERNADEDDAVAFGREQEVEIDAEARAAAEVEGRLAAMQKRHVELPILNAAKAAELERLTAEYGVMERHFMEAHSDEERRWSDLVARHALEDATHNANKAFVGRCLEALSMHAQYVALLRDNLVDSENSAALLAEVERTEVSEWVRRAIVTMGNNAVTLSHRAAAKARAPKTRPQVPLSRPTSFRIPSDGAGAASPPPPPPPPPPPSSQQPPASPSAEPSSPVAPSSPQRPKAPPRAMSLYDQPNLLADIEGYIQNGTTLLKHGRSGAPHFRYFYVLVGESSCRLCWDEDETGKRDGSGSSIDLARVTKLVLGQTSEVFLRSRSRSNALNSFSIHYIKKQEFRTLDIVCETDAELEAWVIGLCRIIGTNPFYEDRLAIDGLEDVARLDDAERALCSTWFIEPKLLLAVKAKVREIAVRRKVDSPKMTPGDVRFIAQVDIFRASALWNHLSACKLVQAPNALTMRNYLQLAEIS